MQRRIAPLFGLAALALFATPASATLVFLSGTSCSTNGVDVSWTIDDDLVNPYPAWVGYDIWRSSPLECTGAVRLNAQTIPRETGTHSAHTWHDATAVPGAQYYYVIVPVNANRARVELPNCDCIDQAWSNCPTATTPAIRGTIDSDWGWALAIRPCPNSCWPGVYFEGPLVEKLRPYVGTGTTFDFFGTIGCGSVEGCGIALSDYAPAACGSTPTRATSWGTIKSTYR